MSAFKILRGTAVVKHLGEEPQMMAVDLVESARGVLNMKPGALGVRILEGPLAGSVILVSKSWLESIAHEGQPADHLEL